MLKFGASRVQAQTYRMVWQSYCHWNLSAVAELRHRPWCGWLVGHEWGDELLNRNASICFATHGWIV